MRSPPEKAGFFMGKNQNGNAEEHAKRAQVRADAAALFTRPVQIMRCLAPFNASA